MSDLFNKIDVKPGIVPLATAITDNTAMVSTIFDMADYESAVFVTETGTLADAGATFTALAESGNDSALADATATPDDQLNGTEALASFDQTADSKVFKLGFRGGYKRYARVTITPAGNAAAAPVTGVWIGQPKIRPAANPPA